MSFLQCDVSSWESQADAFEKVYADQGRIDIVFANAGISKEGKLIETDRAQRGEKPMKPDLGTLNVNLVGVIYCQCFHLSLLFGLSVVVMVKLTLIPSYETRNPLHLQKRRNRQHSK